jgi:predicted esterase
MQTHHLAVTRTARYCTLGQLNEHTTDVWFVIHGYGQLSEYFIQKFEPIANEHTFVVAPEALSRFYLKGFVGRVGATWMTREDRDAEISDYVNYLQQLYDTVLPYPQRTKVRIHLLAFSQGTTTLCRWIERRNPQFDRLILWAGYFGNGLADVLSAERVALKEVHVVYGTQDEFLSQVDTAKYEDDVRSVIPHVQIHTFEGTHTIDAPTLTRL